MIIKRVGPLSCARITGTLYAALGLIIGALFSLVAVIRGVTASPSAWSGFPAALGIAAIVAFPVFYGVVGFVSSLVAAWLYNILANAVGGIQIELE